MKDLDYFKAHEIAYRTFVSDDRYLVLRMDGKAFHSYTKGLERPFDTLLIAAMNETAKILCQQIDGAIFAYVQSDEISVIVDNKKNENTMPWLGGAIQKLVSISASICSVNFNRIRMEQGFNKIAYFDSRAFTFNTLKEIKQYYQWRRADAMKNSVSMAAETYFSHRVLTGLNTDDRKNALRSIDKPWDNLDEGFKYGRLIFSQLQDEEVSYTHSGTGESNTVIARRKRWFCEAAVDEAWSSHFLK